jgi:hypothetical protein
VDQNIEIIITVHESGRCRDQIPVDFGDFAHPSRPALWNEHRFSFPVVKRRWLGVDYPPPFSAEVKERLEL